MDVDHEGAGTTMRPYRRVSLHLHTPHSIQSKYAHVSTCTSIIVLTGRRAPSRLRLFFASDLSFSARTFHPPNDYILHLQPPPTSQTASVSLVLVLFRLHTLPFSLLRALFTRRLPFSFLRYPVSFRASSRLGTRLYRGYCLRISICILAIPVSNLPFRPASFRRCVPRMINRFTSRSPMFMHL